MRNFAGTAVNAEDHPAVTLRLTTFTPFRLNRLAAGVSEYLADIYRERFGLDIPMWRVMATVGLGGGCTAQQVALSTRMHKTRVSRAIAALIRRGLLSRCASAADGRARPLALTRAGRRMYADLVPLALERERTLLSCLPRAPRAAFLDGLQCLEAFLRLT
ncbi:MAG TPA: MarR family winged helix-turn-helix transcriptional regulator [Steroidobacteraceae bacterium]